MTAEAPPQRVDKFAALLFERAPVIAAAAAFLVGAVTVIALAAPHLPIAARLDWVDRMGDEFPEWGASVGGVALMALSTGLRNRIDAAWAATVALLAAAGLYAFFRHDHPIGALAAGAALIGLVVTRSAFYRRSHLTRLVPGPRAALAAALALGAGLVAAVLWAGENPHFAEAPWWALLTDPHLGRPGRALAISALALGGLVMWRAMLVRPHEAPPPGDSADLARAERVIVSAENTRPDAQLALLGDKSFLFADDAFVMHARGGGSLIAMLGPIGKQRAWRGALAAFRQQADTLSLRPVVYGAPPEMLPDLIDVGFRVEKIGENAIVPLTSFSLAGPAKQNLRNARRRFVEKESGGFELHEPPHAPALLDTLEQISNVWLAAHGGREKAFSLGRFDRAFLAHHPIAIAHVHGAPVAFANIWTTADKSHAALDLMRFDPERAPDRVMDFLFTEMLLWAQAAGYRDFDLGMAPLAGLPDDAYARLFARFGRFIYERAENFYGFQGLRKFKEKFGPTWEPRYLAAPGAWQMPLVLAEVALLTSGGVAGILPKRKEG